jgi:hypothetical protein
MSDGGGDCGGHGGDGGCHGGHGGFCVDAGGGVDGYGVGQAVMPLTAWTPDWRLTIDTDKELVLDTRSARRRDLPMVVFVSRA